MGSHAVGVILGAGLTLGSLGFCRLLGRGRGKGNAKTKAASTAASASQHSSTDSKAEKQPNAGSDTRRASRDQASGQTTADVAALTRDLAKLKQAEAENAKLQAFMVQHMSASEKVTLLEAENQKLQAVKARLEEELVEIKARPQPMFAISNGEELEKFKGLLNIRMEGVRSVCSEDRAESIGDGAATVQGFATRNHGQGFFSELACLLGLPAPRTGSISRRPATPKGSQAGSVASAAIAPRPPIVPSASARTPAPAGKPVDVGAMMDQGWARF